MTSGKNEKFSKDDIRVARFAKALSHPARIAILRQLATLEVCSFNEISKELPLADSTVSQHITELKNAGIISGRADPPNVKYSINFDKWKQARKSLKEFTKMKIAKNN